MTEGKRFAAKECCINKLPDDVFQKILLLAAPNNRDKRCVRLVCQDWGRAGLSLAQHFAVSSAVPLRWACPSCKGLESTIIKLKELHSLAVKRDLSTAEAKSLAELPKLTSLRFIDTRHNAKLVLDAAGAQLASRLRMLELYVAHPFTLGELAHLSSLERVVLRDGRRPDRMCTRNKMYTPWIDAVQLDELAGLPNLVSLEVHQFHEVPVRGLGLLTRLESLKLVGEQVDLPIEGLSCLQELRRLVLEGFKLEDPLILAGLVKLESVTINKRTDERWYQMENDPELPELDHLTRLTELELEDSRAGWLPSFAPSLAVLRINACSFNAALDLDVGQLAPSLHSLLVKNANLNILRLENAASLRQLVVVEDRLFEVHGLEHLSALERLTLRHCCPSLRALPGLDHATRLHTLELDNCQGLHSLPDLAPLACLARLRLAGLLELAEVPSFAKLQGLRVLHISHCSQLKALSGLSSLSSLQKLCLHHLSRAAVAWEDLGRLTGLESLCLAGEIETGSGLLGGLNRLTQLHLAPVQPTERPAALSRLTALRDLLLNDKFSLAGLARDLAGRLPELRQFGLSQVKHSGTDDLEAFVRGMPCLPQLRFTCPTPGVRESGHLVRFWNSEICKAVTCMLARIPFAGGGRLERCRSWEGNLKHDPFDDFGANFDCDEQCHTWLSCEVQW